MGNCMRSRARAENARISHNASEPSKTTSKQGLSSAPSTLAACSNPSTFTITSYTHRRAGDRPPTPRTEGEILSCPSLKSFSFGELRNATRNFHPDSLIGEGGFGYVFKGWIDGQTFTASKPGLGMVVAVKKLKPEGLQGHKEWLTEVNYLGQLHHPHLVKLIGFCLDGDSRLLVYEFMPKGSLENHLFKRGPQPLCWATRIKVAIGAARGLTFLHDAECPVIYRDLKASNILLDSEFNAKLSDFGLAKAGPTGDMTHVSTQVIGTQGYAAPEYIATGRLSPRADVYSFGVVLLELLSGRCAYERSRSCQDQNLVEWARPYLGDKNKVFRIMDPKLEGKYSKRGAHVLANIAMHCITSQVKLRPPMSEVLAALEELQDPKDAEIRRRTAHARCSSPMEKSPRGGITSPLQATPGGSHPSPGVSPFGTTPGGSPYRATPSGSPLPSPRETTAGRSPH